MLKLFTLVLMMMSSDFALAKITEMSLEVRQMKTLRHAYYPEKRDWTGFVGLNWKWQKGGVYWDNQTAFYGDSSQVRHIFWEYEMGYSFKHVDLFYYHKSEHIADSNPQDVGSSDRFPLEDSFGVRINLLH